MFRVVFALCLIAGSLQLEITDFSVPSSAELGDDVELKCGYTTNDEDKKNAVVMSVKWWMQAEDGKLQLLYQHLNTPQANGPQITKKNIGIGSIPGSIVIHKVEPFDSGTYECEVSNLFFEDRKHQNLFVYSKGSGPNITLTKVEDGPDDDEESDVNITCEAEDVTPQPELTITIDNVELTESNTSATKSVDTGLYHIVSNVTVSRSKIGSGQVSCELFFVNEAIQHTPFVATAEYKEDEGEDDTGEEGGSASTTDASVDSVDPSNDGSSLGRSWIPLLSLYIIQFY